MKDLGWTVNGDFSRSGLLVIKGGFGFCLHAFAGFDLSNLWVTFAMD